MTSVERRDLLDRTAIVPARVESMDLSRKGRLAHMQALGGASKSASIHYRREGTGRWRKFMRPNDNNFASDKQRTIALDAWASEAIRFSPKAFCRESGHETSFVDCWYRCRRNCHVDCCVSPRLAQAYLSFRGPLSQHGLYWNRRYDPPETAPNQRPAPPSSAPSRSRRLGCRTCCSACASAACRSRRPGPTG